LEKPFTRKAVSLWCLYLALGRVGMASRELADQLKLRLGEDAARTALLIERGLRRYLQRRGGQLDFFHSQLRQAVFEQYGKDLNTNELHGQMADYFRGLADPETNQSWKGGGNRPFLELPFHLARSKAEELTKILFDFNWLQVKTDKSLVEELIQDYDEVLRELPTSHSQRRTLELMQGGLQLSAHVLARDKNQLVSQLLGRMSLFEEREIRRLLDIAKKWRRAPWLMPLNGCLQPPGMGLLRTLPTNGDCVGFIAVTDDFGRLISAAMTPVYSVMMSYCNSITKRNANKGIGNTLKFFDPKTQW